MALAVSSGIDSSGLPAIRNQGIIPIRWEVISDSFRLIDRWQAGEDNRQPSKSLRADIRPDPKPHAHHSPGARQPAGQA